MKLGYITKETPLNRRAYSGTHFYMHRALIRSFEEVISYGPLDHSYKWIPKAKGKILKLLTQKTYKYQYDMSLAKKIASKIDEITKDQKPDALLASLMTPETAYLETNKPLFITADATFPRLHEAQASHSNLHPSSIRQAKQLEEKAFKKATKLILPLEWLADSAMKDYGIASSKIEVVPYGANIDGELTEDEFKSVLEEKVGSEVLQLLFVGKVWEAKGGPFAEKVAKQLEKLGLNVELNVLGVQLDTSGKDYIKSHGFLHKDNPLENAIIDTLYRKSHFFILPTLAECVGMSFIEAASFGLPAIGTDVGGVPEAVLHDNSGYICQPSTTPEETAEWIYSVWKDKNRYKELSTNAHSHYSKSMNWNSWGERVKEIIEASI